MKMIRFLLIELSTTLYEHFAYYQYLSILNEGMEE